MVLGRYLESLVTWTLRLGSSRLTLGILQTAAHQLGRAALDVPDWFFRHASTATHGFVQNVGACGLSVESYNGRSDSLCAIAMSPARTPAAPGQWPESRTDDCTCKSGLFPELGISGWS